MRILIVKISSMGDVIHNLPILSDIHANFPTADIDWVVEESFVDMLKLHPQINQIIPVAIRRWRKNLFSQQTRHEIKAFKAQLTAHEYDYIVDTQTLLKSAFIACLAKGKRYGQGPNTAREWLAGFFYNHKFSVSRAQHAVDQNRQLSALALNYKLPTNAPDYGLPRAELAAKVHLNLPRRYVMAFHATSRDSKLWPVSHWITLGQQIATQGLILCLPWANEDERHRAELIAAHVPQAIILPKSTLNALAFITAGAQAAIGVDTGLVHLAVAMDVPSIAIYTDTHPDLNGAFAGLNALAINIGGKSQLPNPNQVFNTFQQLGVS